MTAPIRRLAAHVQMQDTDALSAIHQEQRATSSAIKTVGKSWRRSHVIAIRHKGLRQRDENCYGFIVAGRYYSGMK
jgi:hypothetical protein